MLAYMCIYAWLFAVVECRRNSCTYLHTYAYTQFSDCTCPIQTSYTQVTSLSAAGYQKVEGGPTCTQYGAQDIGSPCQARNLCENDPTCRGFLLTKDQAYTPAQPKVSFILVLLLLCKQIFVRCHSHTHHAHTYMTRDTLCIHTHTYILNTYI
jgi:hypothetical protein